MEKHLLLWTLGFFIASCATAFSAGILDKLRPAWPLSRRLILASLTTPVGWLVFQVVILRAVFKDQRAQAGLVRLWPSYLQEVVFEPALKLWVCSAVCAAFLWHTRPGSNAYSRNSRLGYLGLHALFLGCAAAILLVA